MDYYIGLDLGTTGVKSIVFDVDGKILGESYNEYSLMILSDNEIEQDANLWFELSLKAIKDAVFKAQIDREKVKAISISSQGISFVLTDKNDEPLCNAISWLDMRATDEIKEIDKKYRKEEIYRITGKKSNAVYLLPKLMWIKKNRPEIYKRTHKVLMAADFLYAKLTGTYYTDYTMAGGTMYFDINKHEYCKDLLEAFHIDEQLLPKVEAAGKIKNKIKDNIAKRIGISKEVQIVLGAQDAKVAAFGAGICKGCATISLGTAGSIEFISDKLLLDDMMRLPSFCFFSEKQYVMEAVISTTGAALKWLHNTLFENISYREMDMLAENAPIGSHGLLFYPHFAGAASPHWDEQARGSFANLSLSVTKSDMVRSLLEGIAYEMRENIEVYESVSKDKIEDIIIYGGGAKSDIWCTIFCDVTGRKITRYSSPELSNFGAAKLAFLGVNKDANAFGVDFLKYSKTFYPNAENMHLYDSAYKNYICTEEKMING